MNNGINSPGVNGRLSIEMSQTKGITCDHCDHNTFMQTFLMRAVSAVYSPNGEASILPVPVFECSGCGHVNDCFLPDGLKSTDVLELDEDDAQEEFDVDIEDILNR